MRNPKQQSFIFRSHGGSRKNAGRPKTLANEPSHRARKRVNSKIPLHINFKVVQGAPGLRTPKFMHAFSMILRRARERGLTIQHYAIESNHIHLICEADSNHALRTGMISITASIRWAMRRIFMFHGKLFSERYHLHALKTPTEMRNAIKYVLFNHAHHRNAKATIDIYSSAICFDDIGAFINYRYNGYRPRWHIQILEELSQATSWLQREGWRKAKIFR